MIALALPHHPNRPCADLGREFVRRFLLRYRFHGSILSRVGASGKPGAVHYDHKTSTQAALLYRQASRDYMPIHADPDIARKAGFERPISHGLNTLGLACRAALKHFAPRQPEKLISMSVRFAAPAYPGDTIRIELIDDGGGRFGARAAERDVLVLDRGEIGLV